MLRFNPGDYRFVIRKEAKNPLAFSRGDPSVAVGAPQGDTHFSPGALQGECGVGAISYKL
jgi:hypothetical protein